MSDELIDWSEDAWTAAVRQQLVRLQAAAESDLASELARLAVFLPPTKQAPRLAMLDRYELDEEWRRVWIDAEFDEEHWAGSWILRSVGTGGELDEADTPKGKVHDTRRPYMV